MTHSGSVVMPRLFAGWYASGVAEGPRAHLARHGPVPLPTTRRSRLRLIEAVVDSGLRGRGGAGHPTGEKLRAVAASRGRAVVVANGCESEPLSRKDRTLLQLAPHLVLDGAVIAAAALDAERVTLCVHRGDPATRDLSLLAAARTDPVRVTVTEVPRGYVASEASALANYLTTGNARPTTRPPRLSTRGVDRRPTLVDNVETLAHLALIARHGPDWFRAVGTPDRPGTTLVTLGGAVRRPGVHEVASGTSLGALLALAGGPSVDPQAVMVGGWGGVWRPVPHPPPGSREVDPGAEGLGLVTVLPDHACGLAETANILHHLARASAGQCGPCLFGLPTVADEFERLVVGPTTRLDNERVRRHLADVTGRGACSHPDGAARLATSALEIFADDLRAHQAGRPCLGASSPPVLSAPVRARRSTA